MDGERYSESSLTGKAVTYAYTRWDNMMRILDDGQLLPDNNLAENEIRPITLGRKNYMFCGNHESAGNMCVIQSLLATCRNHDVSHLQTPYCPHEILSAPLRGIKSIAYDIHDN